MVSKFIKRFKDEIIFNDLAESMIDARERLYLITKARWILILLLSSYGITTAGVFFGQISLSKYLHVATLPIFVVAAMAAINAFYHWNFYFNKPASRTRISLYIKTQIALDIIFTTLLVHLTGGVIHSWFWVLYILITLELTYVIPNQFQIFAVGFFSSLIFTSLVLSEYFELIAAPKMPIVAIKTDHRLTYFLITWFWINLINYATAFISTYMHGKEKSSVMNRIVKDGLTGLYNRRHFNHSINSELARAKRYNRVLSLLMIDIDDFKQFNDTFGHQAGDTILTIVASVLKMNVRGGGDEGEQEYDIDIVCRYGGEEFAIILPETGEAEGLETARLFKRAIEDNVNKAYTTAERMRECIEKTSASTCRQPVTISIGVASYPVHAQEAKELIDCADKALYKAKAMGKNKTVVSKNSKAIPMKKKVS